MKKYNAVHPDTDQKVVAYKLKDIRKEYSHEMKRAKIFSRHQSSEGIHASMFAQYTGVGAFKGRCGHRGGNLPWCVVASKFDAFIEKSGWKTNDELSQETPAQKSAPSPEPAQMQLPLPERAEPASETPSAIAAALASIAAAINNHAAAINNHAAAVQNLGKFIVEGLLSELPSRIFQQQQNVITRLVKNEIVEALDKATNPGN